MFAAQTYVARRARLKDRLGSGLVLLLGHDESPMNYADNVYPFRQESSFLYFFGLDTPGLAAVIDLDEDREILFGKDPSLHEVVWTGPQRSIHERAVAAGVAQTAPRAELATYLGTAIRRSQRIHFLPAYRAAGLQKIERLLGLRAQHANRYASRPLIEAVIAQRSIKSEEEVEEIEKALAVSFEMHTLARRLCTPGCYEREVAGAVAGVVWSAGGHLAFPIILSIHGETLHNHSHHNVMSEGDLLVHDSGAMSPRHYASDITRTLPVGGTFTEQQREVYEVVLGAQQAAIRAVRPGVPYKDVHLLACKQLTDGLKGLGLMRGDVEEAVAAGAHAIFFPCGVGHMIGLDVHDMEALGEDLVGYGPGLERSAQFGLCYLRLARALEPGFVVTVEPGVYFIPALLDRWKAERTLDAFINYDRFEHYRDFGGIRIEDDVLVTPEGGRILGKPIPRTLADVEAWASS